VQGAGARRRANAKACIRTCVHTYVRTYKLMTVHVTCMYQCARGEGKKAHKREGTCLYVRTYVRTCVCMFQCASGEGKKRASDEVHVCM